MSDLPCGFILTRHQREIAGSAFLEFWLVGEDGPVKLSTPIQQAVFFIPQHQHAELQDILNSAHIPFTCKNLELKDFDSQPIAAIYFNKPSQAYNAKECLKQKNVTCYEDDIRLTERFLMERFIYGSAQYLGSSVNHT